MSLLNLVTIKDLLYYFPKYYHDFSKIVKISELSYDKLQTVKVVVSSIKNIRLRSSRIRSMQRAKVYDESTEIDVVWFNQPFIVTNIEEGQEIYLAAKLNPKSTKPQISNPDYEIVKEESVHTARITPVYGLTGGIKQKWLRQKLKWLVDKLDYIVDLEEHLSNEILSEFNLSDLKFSLQNIHFPEDNDNLALAQRRLGFDEMLSIQLILEKTRKEHQNKVAPNISSGSNDVLSKLTESLEFRLTEDQNNAINDIYNELNMNVPMRKLLNGDVGSGKTIVAISVALKVIKEGHNVLVMAPTTVLANQLYMNFKKILSKWNININLVSSDTKISSSRLIKNREGTTEMYATPCITIGTHALLYLNDSYFRNLGVLIVDEQHRFGVEQREEIIKKAKYENKLMEPHYLMMTATPIPRTMAMTFFGDMSISTISEIPKDRKQKSTYLVPNSKRTDSYTWIKDFLNKNQQLFWICPLIEESEKLIAKSIKETEKHLHEIFKEYKIEVLHGQMKEEQKNDILARFQKNEFQILLSTSVIEVGIDIPNANLMVIEGAERFGLAQLHQLRGRIGRGDKESYCLIFASDDNTISLEAKERLKYFASETSGLKIAEYDLERRGPGEVYGTRQSGIPDLKIAKLNDLELIQETGRAAKIILNNL